MLSKVPYSKLGISPRLEERLGEDAPREARLAIAKGLMPVPPNEQLGALYALACGDDAELRSAAIQSLQDLPERLVLQAVSVRTHPKILEFLVEFRAPDAKLDERIGMLRTANDRTVVAIAERCGSSLCELLARNHERLLVTPDVFVALHANPSCPDRILEAAQSFLRMQRQLPEVPEVRPFLAGGDDLVGDGAFDFDDDDDALAPLPTSTPPPAAEGGGGLSMDLLAEVEAALRGEQSPAFVQAQSSNLDMFNLDALDDGPDPHAGFSFDFTDEGESFSWDLTADHGRDIEDRGELRRSLEQQIKDMSVGHKIKLAYRGNKEVRGILIRDTNKVIASAVVKSGRLTDQEVASFAGNKNLDGEVLREIAANSEFTRKYPVKVALVNNPKTPVSMAVTMVNSLQKKDLMSLTRNRNVPSVVTTAATRLFRKKYRQ